MRQDVMKSFVELKALSLDTLLLPCLSALEMAYHGLHVAKVLWSAVSLDPSMSQIRMLSVACLSTALIKLALPRKEARRLFHHLVSTAAFIACVACAAGSGPRSH